MQRGLCLAALGLLVSAVGATAQGKAAMKTPAALKNPAALKATAPAKYKAQFETTKGIFVVDVTRAWSPNGADRFYNLVKNGFFDGVKFFRVVPNFVVQFGIHGDPAIASKWLESNIVDDKVVESNKRGFLTFAKSGAPNSRSTQLFINLVDNDRLDAIGFSAFGKVSKGMDVVDKLYGGYGEQITQLQGQIAAEGNKYLETNWPKLDAIKKATLLK
jgi:peptidyl-prolyl cis-trans isomerase A (cyclophilin A)